MSSNKRFFAGKAGSVSAREGATGPPATLTRKSGVPTCAASFSTSSASVRSATIRSPAWWISVAKTCTPSSRNLFLMELPIPLAAPVISAFLPRSPSSGIRGSVDVDRHAGEVRGVVGAKRDDQRRGLGHGADPAQRDLRERAFGSFFL